ncbi:hypothetical protein PDG61_27755 [Mycolicibacterium sp. BiH015]|uniref:hypothetical protein n=1 Tax=Mycolicibacterium sp. BiH015 TaxID=3018808 RepID=UPI0022DF000E|nr:hypothetical protein [Mycolicibacterium sp. BiH015]MDA2894736.1 hypothetical protein [Mycolicibacterium sp. BiH015]
MAALAAPAVLGIAPAHAAPLPDVCVPAAVVDGVCTSRLVSVTADAVNGTFTGTPVGGGAAITLAGQADAYLKSEGFGAAPPEAVKNWDTSIEQTAGLSTDPSDPNWYGNAKAKVFLPRTLNGLATQFPPNTLVVRFASDETQPDVFRLISVQPVA